MSMDYASFRYSGGPIREPQKFGELKRDDQFATFLARNISSNFKGGEAVDDIARTVLSHVDYDASFARKVVAKMDRTALGPHHDQLSKVERVIHQRELLKPSDFYDKKTPVTAGRGSPASSPKARVRSMPRDISPHDEKEKKQCRLYLETMVKHLSGDKKAEIKGPMAEVLQVLKGQKSPKELPIDKDNSKEYLTAVKLWDHAMAIKNVIHNTYEEFHVSSYNLRTEIALKGELSSHVVYTKTLDEEQLSDWSYLEKQSNWVPERGGIHAHIIQTNLVKALSLSRRLNTESPSVWAVRGNTGAGKTYSISNDEKFAKALDENGESSGAINPDVFKGALKSQSRIEAIANDTGTLSHGQLHMEGSALSFQYAETLGKEAVNATMIIDMRLAQASQVRDEVIGRANNRSGKAMMLDIETPVVTSINRVLTRDPNGDDPIVPLWAIKRGYMEIRNERAAVLQEIKNNNTVQYFKLLITNDRGDQEVAAVKENGKFDIKPGMESKVEKAMEKPEDDEVDKIAAQKIDEDYIKLARTRDHISSAKIHMIERWKGYTVKEALEKHARGESP